MSFLLFENYLLDTNVKTIVLCSVDCHPQGNGISPRQNILFCFCSRAGILSPRSASDLPRPEGEQTNWHDTTVHTVVTRAIRPAHHRLSLYIILSRRRRSAAARPVFYNMLHFTVWHVATHRMTQSLQQSGSDHRTGQVRALQTTDHTTQLSHSA